MDEKINSSLFSPKRRKSLDLIKKLNKEKKKLSDYEIQTLKKKKMGYFSSEFLKSMKFIKDKSNKRLYSMKTVQNSFFILLINYLYQNSIIF